MEKKTNEDLLIHYVTAAGNPYLKKENTRYTLVMPMHSHDNIDTTLDKLIEGEKTNINPDKEDIYRELLDQNIVLANKRFETKGYIYSLIVEPYLDRYHVSIVADKGNNRIVIIQEIKHIDKYISRDDAITAAYYSILMRLSVLSIETLTDELARHMLNNS